MQLLVTADDRTGAYETAGALADRLRTPVEAAAYPDAPAAVGVAVIDLATRHLASAEAATRVRAGHDGRPRAHKIDSVLRGNWAAELTSIAARRPVLLTPALPQLGRFCRGGVVHADGVAVASVDRRPAETLGRHGITAVEAPDVDAVRRWLAAPFGVCVADAASTADLDGIADEWRARATQVVLAGTSATIAAAVETAPPPQPRTAVWSERSGCALVVCGSAHPAARRQLAVLDTDETADVTVLALPEPAHPVSRDDAAAAASHLAVLAADSIRSLSPAVLVIIGGDTAAALIGRHRMTVHGSVEAGTPWGYVTGWSMPVVTRSGGFGSDDSLAGLISGTLRP